MSRPLSEDEQQVVADNIELAEQIARKYAWMSSYEEMFSVGCEALCRAARNYAPDEHNGTPFSAYARIYVEGSVKRFGHRDQSIVPMPRKYRKLRYASYREKQQAALERELGREVTDEDMAKAHGLSVSEYVLACAAGGQREEEDPTIHSPAAVVEAESIQDDPRIEAALKVLSPRDETIIRRIYGINCEAVRQDVIAEEVGIATPIVPRRHVKALARLRALLTRAARRS